MGDLVDITSVSPGTMIHYEYDAGAGKVTIVGIVGPFMGMAELGNQGVKIHTGSGPRYVSRLARVTVLD